MGENTASSSGTGNSMKGDGDGAAILYGNKARGRERETA